jgi:folate-dependent phosphoribosylglycinamide formyltransferase PurN
VAIAEARHAVTLHWTEGEIDNGPIAYKACFEVTEDDTGLSVAARVSAKVSRS